MSWEEDKSQREEKSKEKPVITEVQDGFPGKVATKEVIQDDP
ncbi:hypothetical protein [Thermus thermophilus]|nr:hypothetical protein [Thermus thermophilus]